MVKDAMTDCDMNLCTNGRLLSSTVALLIVLLIGLLKAVKESVRRELD